MLTILPEQYIGEGNQRTVYNHPNDAGLCIKITKPNSETAKRRQKREIKFYKSLKRRNVSFENISDYIGEVETDKGMGYVYEKVLDYDGELSKGLEELLTSLGPESEQSKEVITSIQRLGIFIKDNRVIFHDYLIRDNKNILCRKEKDHSYTPVIVDGLGDTVLIPIGNLSKKHSQKRIVRKWKKFLIDPTLVLLPWIRREDLEI